MALGLGSNLIVRDGGVAGVVVRLGKPFAKIEQLDETTLRCGGGASGILVSSTARDKGIAGLEFLRGIPGTVGGFVRMNGGAYGREVKRHAGFREARSALGRGRRMAARQARLHLSPQRSARRRGGGRSDVPRRTRRPDAIGAEMDAIARAREESQPLRSRTGGSTFKNPPGHKAWALIDAAGCRGLQIGGAQVSEKHCNFLLNLGSATSADIEALGEEVRRRVEAKTHITLEWEIQRVGTGMNKDLHVVVLMGGWSSEREVSLTSGAGVARRCASAGGRNVTELDIAIRN